MSAAYPPGVLDIVLLTAEADGDAYLHDFLTEAADGAFRFIPMLHAPENFDPASFDTAQAFVLDKSLSGREDSEAIREIVRKVGDRPVLVLNDGDDLAFERAALSAGARACLRLGHHDGFAITQAIRSAVQSRHIEHALKTAESRVQALIKNAKDAVITTDSFGHIVSWNGGAEAMFGYAAEDIIGRPIATLMPERYRTGHFQRLSGLCPAALDDADPDGELLGLKSDGSEFPIHHSVTTFTEGGETFYTAVIRDKTPHRRVADLERTSSAIFEASSEAIMITGTDNRIMAVNEAFSRITGYSAEEVIGERPNLLNSGKHDPAFYEAMWETLSRDGKWQGEIWNRRKSGEIFPEWLTITAIRDETGNIIKYAALFSDISVKKEDEETRQRLATYDPLTGIPNRNLLYDRLRQAMVRADRSGNRVALMFIDLDRFKQINAALGHSLGDKLLQAVAERISETVYGEDTVARIGGDEFVALLPEIRSEKDVVKAAKRLLGRMQEPFMIQGREVYVGISMGVSIYPTDDRDLDALVRAGDSAMRLAGQRGRNTFQFFKPEMNVQNLERIKVEQHLRTALQNNEFRQCFQPQIDLASRRLIGAEALIRWHNPHLGNVRPDRFIPLAEDIGLISDIGAWTLREACRQMVAWTRSCGQPLRVAVNVSTLQFEQPGFVHQVAQVLNETGLPPEQLELELTESLLIEDSEQTLKSMQALSAMGVAIAIDDFGTGFSSLSYLKRFPVDKLKIDQAFIRDINKGEGDQALVAAIIAMGHALKQEVIAEGVEHADQIAALETLGCDTLQGFFFGKPVEADEFETLFLSPGSLAS